MPRSVIVTDGEHRATLAAVRSLGSAGWRVHVCASAARSLAGSSRYAAREVVLPSSLDAPAEFASAIGALARSESADVVLPMTDSSLLAILPERDGLLPTRVPFPDLAVYRSISDKALLLAKADRLGIAVPAQTIFHNRTGLDALKHEVCFPAVLKPSRSVVETRGVRHKTTVRHVADWAAMRTQVLAMPEGAFPLLVQQRIVGPGVGIFLLRWNGQILAQFAHRRLREKPPSGGVSVYRESIEADPVLVMKSDALLTAFDWRGPAMIEYKVDRATGTPYLMEINGRFWGSLQLAVDAGVDFPLLLCRIACGEAIQPIDSYRVGVRSRWWWGDVDHLLARFRKSNSELALPDDAPSRLRSLLDFLKVWRPGDRNEVFRAGDPWPALRETAAWFRRQ